MQAAARRSWSRLALVLVVAAVAVPLVARATATQWHDDVLWANAARAAGGSAEPYDLRIFLEAGDDVVSGRSPYVEPEAVDASGGSLYVYPPLLAFVVAPLAVLPERVSDVYVPGAIVSLLLVFSIVGALLLLDVRDWRCYPVALLYPVNLEAVEYGALGPFLLLLVALLWRHRDRQSIAVASSGVAVVLKLFLWPILVWLAFTGRVRAAVLGAALAAALALFSWAAIGFAGIADYPRLLGELVDLEGANSYSAYAVLATIGVPDGIARLLVIVLALVLLAFAWRAARAPDESPAERDRRSLTLALAAALVATPILWLHYLGLLLVPIALASRRLSLLWLAPLSMTLFEALDWYRGWPRGDGEALVSVSLVVAFVFVGALARRGAAGQVRRVAGARSAPAASP